MQSLFTKTYVFDEKTKIDIPLKKVTYFFNHEPEKFLEIAGLQILNENYKNEKSGEWQVSEKIGCFLPPTQFLTAWQSTEFGSKWNSLASLGVSVDNSWQIRSMFSFDDSQQQEDETMCVMHENAILHCPIYLYPFVKYTFVKNHKKLHKSLQCKLSQFIQ